MEAPPSSQTHFFCGPPSDKVRTEAYFKPVATCSLVETCGFPETGWRSEKQARGRLRPLAHPSSPTRVQGGEAWGGGEGLLPASMTLVHTSAKGEAEVRVEARSSPKQRNQGIPQTPEEEFQPQMLAPASSLDQGVRGSQCLCNLFQTTLNVVENTFFFPNLGDLLFPRPQDQLTKTKQNKNGEEDFFFKHKAAFYLQSLQLLQILEGASLDDADLVVFQMPRIRKAARVKDQNGIGALMRGLRLCSHITYPLLGPLGPSNWNRSDGTK